ncbi:hypothetical protein BN59_00735 [Legionella massiliensis]|uniref:Uncharacterized protein n=1 Tax=Legionella massiliensis TaxID=1034943 RepID=A0A078KTV8_9GAMM|nr:hypothetical protein [Legionella massiliensis]CDZ76466.1 hypothetical protein BN59_00735 [Legionella massiliensis]CEE12204.1 hypothetical protein BN1094_00735 [Legionella massiliensis]
MEEDDEAGVFIDDTFWVKEAQPEIEPPQEEKKLVKKLESFDEFKKLYGKMLEKETDNKNSPNDEENTDNIPSKNI